MNQLTEPRLFDKREPDTSMCCRRFYLPYSYNELKEDYERFIRDGHSRWLEIDKIFPMLIHLGEFDCLVDGTPTDNPHHHYSCRHLDVATGNCAIYNGDRPTLCRTFPDNVIGEFKRCQNLKCKTFNRCNGIKEYRKYYRFRKIKDFLETVIMRVKRPVKLEKE